MFSASTPELITAPVANVVDALALLALGAALLLVAIQRLAPAVWTLAVQSLALALMVGLIAAATGAVHLWVAAGLTLGVKVLLVPRILFYVIDRLKVRREVEPVLPVRLALVFAAGLSLLAYWVTAPLAQAGLPVGQTLPTAVACMLLGGLLMVIRRKALMQLIGLMVIENGIYLAAMGVTRGMPLLVELGVFFDLLVGVLVMGIIVFRINQTFDTIDTDRLQRLRH